jgi:hypothetical protein
VRQSFAIPLYRQGSANLSSSSRWRRRSVWSCQSEPVDWEYAGVNTFRAGRADDLAMHPTVEPTAMMADAIRDVTKRGAVVLDPFAGSGTTSSRPKRPGEGIRPCPGAGAMHAAPTGFAGPLSIYPFLIPGYFPIGW